jgi:DNA polymerase III epsilon subunit-like protein
MKPHYCFIDTETTGLHADAEIISIALVFTDDEYRVLKSHVRHFLPNGYMHPKAAEVNGYTDELWLMRQEQEGFTNEHDEWHTIFDLLSCRYVDGKKENELTIIAQNTAFDMRMLYEVQRKKPYLNSHMLNRCLDLASFAVPFMIDRDHAMRYHSLELICQECGVKYKNAHDALADTLMMLNCWQHISEYYRKGF